MPRPVAIDRLQVLETGCGQGYGVLAMARHGVQASAGVDLAGADTGTIAERPMVLRRLHAADPHIAARVEIATADIGRMPFDDVRFDLVHSNAVLEHVHDLPRALKEMARVVKPGGMMIHAFNPFFGCTGGHAVCTLDLPWGHARLNRDDFLRYHDIHRPHERAVAERMFEHHFPTPRIALLHVEQILAAAGFSVLSWREHWRPNHLPSSDVCREVNAVYPSASLPE